MKFGAIYIGFLCCCGICFFILASCEQSGDKTKNTGDKYQLITTSEYDLIKAKNQNALLILFPGYGGNSKTIEGEFKIENFAKQNGLSLLLLNYNGKLFLTEKDKIELSLKIQSIIENNKLELNNIIFGGMSSGGNVALLLGNYLSKVKSVINPKGIFIVDSPVDLHALYKTSQKNIQKNVSNISIQESTWLINLLQNNLGKPKESLESYESLSPYTSQTKVYDNLKYLKDTKLRFYTEPDLEWWKLNRQNDWEDLNAYSILKLANELTDKFNNELVEYIPTSGKGFKSSGQRHPHSWSIVNKPNLLNWTLNN